MSSGTVMRVVHAVPGRVRLKVPALKGNASMARAACEELRTVAGVREVWANPITGSLVVRYDAERVRSMGAFHQLLEPVQALFPDPLEREAFSGTANLEADGQPSAVPKRS